MAITAQEAREQILDDLGGATEQLALSLACLGEAYEQLSVTSADRMEAELYRPVQKAFGRAKRGFAQYAGRVGLADRQFEAPSPGPASQTAGELVDRAGTAAAEADLRLAGLQDSDVWIEFGDAELRAALAEVRGLLDQLPAARREFLRTLGR